MTLTFSTRFGVPVVNWEIAGRCRSYIADHESDSFNVIETKGLWLVKMVDLQPPRGVGNDVLLCMCPAAHVTAVSPALVS